MGLKKIINTSNKPYEFTWDGGHYGPYMPGQIVELPDNVANHAIKRSVVLDDTGGVLDFQMQELSAVSREKVKEIAMFECPFVASGMCNEPASKTSDELWAHLIKAHRDLVPENLKGSNSQTATRATK